MRELGHSHSIGQAWVPSLHCFNANRRRVRAAAAGTTLIELIVACSILLVLATAAVPLMRVTVKGSQERRLRAALRDIRNAIDRYKDDADRGKIQTQVGNEGYPPDLETLVKGVQTSAGQQPLGVALPTQQQGGGQQQQHRVRYLREIPMDPMTKNKEWGLRSVHDDPDSTSWGGHDVFDVYSKSTGTALDGTKYSDW